jgi:tRNA modification GTPase
MHSIDDTIAAIATAPGRADRGIVRISGPNAVATVQQFFEPIEPVVLAKLRTATCVPGTVAVTLANRPGDQPLPCDLYLWPTNRSYTRQPVAELHTLGSPPILQALLRTACAAGARLAEPGEFTLRAFLAGRIDLVQAEAVLGVIDAEDRRQLDVALAQLAGGLTRPLKLLRDQLLDLLADLEAGLDFVEEDIRFVTGDEPQRRLSAAAAAVAQLVEQMRGRNRTDFEPRVVLVGWPNVGKSSLFNALIGSGPAALVSSQPGTTRDYLTARLQLGGIPLQLIDTAGIEAAAAADTLATAAQQITDEQHQRADLRLLCLDASRPLNDWEQTELCSDRRHLAVLTKCDLATSASCHAKGIETSTKAGLGIDSLKSVIQAELTAVSASLNSAGAVSTTAVRCRDSLRLTAESLARARDMATAGQGDELIAAEIRTALLELGKVVGTIYTEDLLDRIFSRFCIGK